jgi:hypothetical protein
MPEINNSFEFQASNEILKPFLKHMHDSYFTESDIDNYEEEFQSETKLTVYFDSFGTLKEFVNKAKKAAKKFKVDFDCTLIVGWSLEGDYYLYTYRHESDELNCYELLSEHKKLVKIIDESTYEFQEKKYNESDVLGVLGSVMIDHFYKDNLQRLKS